MNTTESKFLLPVVTCYLQLEDGGLRRIDEVYEVGIDADETVQLHGLERASNRQVEDSDGLPVAAGFRSGPD